MLKKIDLLDEVVKEIGEYIIVQVVTDNASAYKVIGALLMDKRKNLNLYLSQKEGLKERYH